MPSYILRNIDRTLWDRVKARSAADGLHLRALILGLLTHYADGKLVSTSTTAVVAFKDQETVAPVADST